VSNGLNKADNKLLRNIRKDNTTDQKTSLLEGVCLVMRGFISRPLQHKACLCHTLWGYLPENDGGRHRHMSPCSMHALLFLKRYMCVVLDEYVDNNLIDRHSTSNTVKFTVN